MAFQGRRIAVRTIDEMLELMNTALWFHKAGQPARLKTLLGK